MGGTNQFTVINAGPRMPCSRGRHHHDKRSTLLGPPLWQDLAHRSGATGQEDMYADIGLKARAPKLIDVLLDHVSHPLNLT